MDQTQAVAHLRCDSPPCRSVKQSEQHGSLCPPPRPLQVAYTMLLSQDGLLLLSERLGFLVLSTASSPGCSGASLVLQISSDTNDNMLHLSDTKEFTDDAKCLEIPHSEC